MTEKTYYDLLVEYAHTIIDDSIFIREENKEACKEFLDLASRVLPTNHKKNILLRIALRGYTNSDDFMSELIREKKVYEKMNTESELKKIHRKQDKEEDKKLCLTGLLFKERIKLIEEEIDLVRIIEDPITDEEIEELDDIFKSYTVKEKTFYDLLTDYLCACVDLKSASEKDKNSCKNLLNLASENLPPLIHKKDILENIAHYVCTTPNNLMLELAYEKEIAEKYNNDLETKLLEEAMEIVKKYLGGKIIKPSNENVPKGDIEDEYETIFKGVSPEYLTEQFFGGKNE